MPMPHYVVRCYTPACESPAAYKVAAAWSDGATGELKTYALACEGCVAEWYRAARERRAACRLVSGEKLDEPGIYAVDRGARDRQPERMTALEARLVDFP